MSNMSKKKVIIVGGVLLVAVIVALSTSYAMFRFNITKNTNFKLALGTLELTIKDTTTEDKFILENTVPTKDDVALEQDGYKFTLTNTGTIDSYYNIYLDDVLLTDAGDRLDNSYIRFNLFNESTDQSSTSSLSSYASDNRMITSGFLKKGESVSYILRMWVKYDAGNEAQNKYFATQIRVVGTQSNAVGYQEDILNGSYPVLKDNLVPVVISDTGVVTKADTSKEWYSYEKKNWANAVILKDESVVYKNGEEIPESAIKQYYVWIPRYRYQLWNVDSNSNEKAEKAINIVFESKDTKVSTGTKNGEWLTHPAFTSFDTNGIWVGKFETSYDEETYTDSSLFLTKNPNHAKATDASNIIIKPNVRILTNKVVSTFYTLGRGVNENLNSHMMKNMEWGATAYLTYSLYGKCTADGCEEVYINNINTGYLGATAKFSGQWEYSASITGCSASTASAGVSSNQSSCASEYAYNGSSNKASTTGNISGIYDMSGGNWEYVMGVIQDVSGKPMSGRNNLYNSGFNGTYGYPTSDGQTATSKTNGIAFPTDTRYYDLYVPNSTTLGDDTWYKYTNSKLGDASKEVAISKTNSSSGDRGLWFSDYALFPTATHPWVYRGGNFHGGSGAGVFYFSRTYGSASSIYGFRVVLAPTK